MICINDDLIQKYIDGEASQIEVTSISKHISSCQLCAAKIDNQRDMANRIRTAINLLAEDVIEIPKFIPPNQRKKINDIKLKRLIYILTAACILFFVLFITQNEQREAEEEIIIFNNFEWDYDANRTISQQNMTINVIDADGKISEYQFE